MVGAGNRFKTFYKNINNYDNESAEIKESMISATLSPNIA
jgi:hypothetical protein